MKLSFVVGLAGMLASPIASASSYVEDMATPTVGAFSRACQPVRMQQRGERLSPDQELVAGMCLGYFLSEADGDPLSPPTYCAPQGANLQQRALIFLKWADDNPKHLNLDRKIGVQLSMIEAFPCKN